MTFLQMKGETKFSVNLVRECKNEYEAWNEKYSQWLGDITPQESGACDF